MQQMHHKRKLPPQAFRTMCVGHECLPCCAIAPVKKLRDLRPQRPQSTGLSGQHAGFPQVRPLHTVLRDSV